MVQNPRLLPTRIEDQLSLDLRGALEQLQWASPAAPTPRSVRTEAITPTPVATLPPTSPQATPSSGSIGPAWSTQQLFWPSRLKSPDAGIMPHFEGPLATMKGELNGLSEELLHLQEEMNIALV